MGSTRGRAYIHWTIVLGVPLPQVSHTYRICNQLCVLLSVPKIKTITNIYCGDEKDQVGLTNTGQKDRASLKEGTQTAEHIHM